MNSGGSSASLYDVLLCALDYFYYCCSDSFKRFPRLSAGDRQVNSQTGVTQVSWQTSVQVKRQTGELSSMQETGMQTGVGQVKKGGQTGVYSTGKLPDK